MANILEVITGISQALHAKHHGGADFGLKRETEDLTQGCSIYDPRVMDGFGVQFQGESLILKYHSEMPLAKVHDKNFETDIRDTVKQLVKHLKEEYKLVTKSALSLLEQGDIQIMVQTANRRTCYVNAVQVYKIGNVKLDKEDSKEYHTVSADGTFKVQSADVYASNREHMNDVAKRWLMNVKAK